MADKYKKKTLFSTLCKKAGLILKNGSGSNEINVDKTVFQRNVTHFLKNQTGDVTEAIEEFLEGFGEYIDDRERFHRSLLPTFTTAECESARSQVQDSVVRLLLGVEIIQPPLIRNLVEKLPEFSEDDDVIFDAGERVNIPHLLLAQLRWLDFMVDSKALRENLLEMLNATSEHVQQEIISVLPAVLDDADHTIVATKLKEILVNRCQLTVVVLDTLTCLELTPDLLVQVRQAAVQALGQVNAENLVVVIKFLLRTAAQSELTEVVAEIRRELDVSSLVDHRPALVKSKVSQVGTSSQKDSEVLIMDAIHSGIQFQRGVAEAWLKVIDSLKGKLNVLDLVVILFLHQTNRKKGVESLVRNKIRNGDLSEVLLRKAFMDHSQILQRLFKSLLLLSEMLLHSPEMSLGYVGGVIYKLIFATFDIYCKQETVGSLVMQLGKGSAEEADAALDVLSSLVEQHLKDVVQFAFFFKRLLDLQQQNMSLQRLRKLFAMLSRLAFYAGNDPALMQDDLHMVIRKLISSVDPDCLCQGLMGGVMMVWGMGTASVLSEEGEQEVTSLLNMLRTASSRHSKASSVLLDELAAVVTHDSLHPKVQAWISEHMTDMFQENFVVDVDDKQHSMTGLPMTAQYGLNQEEESNIVINLLPLVAAEITENQESEPTVYAACLSPHFHLVQTCESHQQNGNMEGIDALLGCPVYLPDENVYEKFESLSEKEKDIVCTSLFHCINWFREVINAFASQSDMEMKNKVMKRLHNITQLQMMLARCLSEHPKYNPQLLGLGLGDQQLSGSLKNKGCGKKGQESKKRKRKEEKEKEAEEEISMDSTSQEKAESNIEKDKQQHLEGGKIVFSQYYRELDLCVFHILRAGLCLQSSMDLDSSSKGAYKVQIQAPQLHLLLEDLMQKLSHSLIASTTCSYSFLKAKQTRRTGFSKLDKHSADQVVALCVELLPALCCHLEAISIFFQALISDDDEIDRPERSTPEREQMALCFLLAVQSLQVLFSWSGFGLSDHRELLKESLAVVTGRIKPDGSTHMSLADLLGHAFLYFEKFLETVPTLVTSTALVKLLAALASRCEKTTLNQQLGELAHQQLQKEWRSEKGEQEKGAAFNEMLQFLVRVWILSAEDPFQTLEDMTNRIISQVQLGSRVTSVSDLPHLTRSTFPVFLRVILSELVDKVKRIPSLRRLDSKETQEEHLLKWSAAVRILFLAVGLVKEFNGRGAISACLKYGRQFVEVFLQRAMPVLDASFTSNSANVHSLLRTLQQSTRTLQIMCGHAKRAQDIAQINQVPLLKRALERLVLRVKHMLTINHCQRAFWVGNLKNKTLQGEEIPSQIVSEQNSPAADREGDQDTMSDEEDDSEVEMEVEETVPEDTAAASDDSDGSYSEMY